MGKAHPSTRCLTFGDELVEDTSTNLHVLSDSDDRRLVFLHDFVHLCQTHRKIGSRLFHRQKWVGIVVSIGFVVGDSHATDLSLISAGMKPRFRAAMIRLIAVAVAIFKVSATAR